MTTVPGTYFTKEQLKADLKTDKLPSGISKYTGEKYYMKKQYDKALAWYILQSMDDTAWNSLWAHHCIGQLYYNGLGVPKNHMCALKWEIKAAEGYGFGYDYNNIGFFFEHGQGVPADKYKALEWYCRAANTEYAEKLKDEGYHRSAADKRKPRKQLVKETEAILDAEKKKLEEKQSKTQEEIETLEQLNITYKLVDGGKDAWENIPILLADDKQHDEKVVNNSVTNNENETHELDAQLQQPKEDIFENPDKELEPLKQEKTNLELQIKGKDEELISLGNNNQLLQREKSTVQLQIQTNDGGINSLQSENQELKLKIISFQTENQALKHRNDEYKQQVEARDNKINLLESEKREYHTATLQLKQEKQMAEQEKSSTTDEMERLKTSYMTLEQLFKSKEDVIESLNRENQILSTTNQGHQQGTNDMVDILKSLLQAKTNETKLVKQNMELLLANEKRKSDALEQEIMALKQERAQLQVTARSRGPSNTNPINSNRSYNGQHDDSYNDLNYETEDSDEDDINYDTPSEDEDNNNDLNYDDASESHKKI